MTTPVADPLRITFGSDWPFAPRALARSNAEALFPRLAG